MKQVGLMLLLSLCAGWAQAENAVTVEDGWVRWVPPVTGNSAAYFTLQNKGAAAVELVAAESAVANAVELHTVVKDGELMQMKPLKKVAIPAGHAVMFEPGSHHVMLIGLKQPLQENQKIPMTLRFADGTTLATELVVKNPVEQDHSAHHDHHQHH